MTVQLSLDAAILSAGSSRSEFRATLERLDSHGMSWVWAQAPVSLQQQGGRYARPRAYLCSDSTVCWVKERSQAGLASELIANRLAFTLGIGPRPKIVRMDAILNAFDENEYTVGTENVPSVISSKELVEARTQLAPGTVHLPTLAHVSVFQSWIDVVDNQVLISLADGRVHSYDHGDTFRSLLPGRPRMIVPAIPGVQLRWADLRIPAMDMAGRIASLGTLEILEAVARMPIAAHWQSTLDRRMSIARWLVKRQPFILAEVDRWTSPS